VRNLAPAIGRWLLPVRRGTTVEMLARDLPMVGRFLRHGVVKDVRARKCGVHHIFAWNPSSSFTKVSFDSCLAWFALHCV